MEANTIDLRSVHPNNSEVMLRSKDGALLYGPAHLTIPQDTKLFMNFYPTLIHTAVQKLSKENLWKTGIMDGIQVPQTNSGTLR